MDFDTLWQDVSLSRIKLTFLQAKLSFVSFCIGGLYFVRTYVV